MESTPKPLPAGDPAPLSEGAPNRARAKPEPVADCPSDRLLRMLWGQWKTHILYSLGTDGPARFGEMQRRVPGITPKVLTTRLRELEADGIIWRLQENTIPAKVTYGLTEMGRDIHAAQRGFDGVAKRWCPKRKA